MLIINWMVLIPAHGQHTTSFKLAHFVKDQIWIWNLQFSSALATFPWAYLVPALNEIIAGLLIRLAVTIQSREFSFFLSLP